MEITIPPYEWAHRITGPEISATAALTVAASAERPTVSPAVAPTLGRSTVRQRKPRFTRCGVSLCQHHPPCHAPCTSTIVGRPFEITRRAETCGGRLQRPPADVLPP